MYKIQNKYACEGIPTMLGKFKRFIGTSGRQVVQGTGTISTLRIPHRDCFIHGNKVIYAGTGKKAFVPQEPIVPPVSAPYNPEDFLTPIERANKMKMAEIAEMAKGDKTVKTQEYYDKLFEEIDNYPYLGGKDYYNPRTGYHIEVYKKDSPELIKVSKPKSDGGYEKMETLYDWSGAGLGLVKAVRTMKDFDGAAYNQMSNSRLQLFDPEEGKYINLHIDRILGRDMATWELVRANRCKASARFDEAMVHQKLADSLGAYFG